MKRFVVLIVIISAIIFGNMSLYADTLDYCFKDLFDNHGSVMLVINVETGKIEDANVAAEGFYGYSREQLLSKTIQDINMLSAEEIEVERKAAASEERNYFIFKHKLSSGELRDVEVYSYPFMEGEKKLLYSIIHDITVQVKNKRELQTKNISINLILILFVTIQFIGIHVMRKTLKENKKKQDEIEYLSFHDQLTGLYNRRFFEEEFKRLDTIKSLPLTLVFADVNGLKLINDAFGHKIGDELIKKTADVLIKHCRKDDVIARVGGDEFIILLPKTASETAEKIVSRIKESLSKEHIGAVEISVSFGWETKTDISTSLKDVYKKAEDNMYKKKLFESTSLRNNMILSIIRSLNYNNEYENKHSEGLKKIASKVTEALNIEDKQARLFKELCNFHDIGIIAIDSKVINKKGPLTEDEWKEIKRHPEVGYRILSAVNEYSELAELVLAHHERWDGKGYPKGLKGEEIPWLARLLAILDAYDAMGSERPYRSALSEHEIIEEIKSNAGTQFDPEIVRLFLERVLKVD